MAQDWFNHIEDAINPVLKEQEQKQGGLFSHDLTAYSKDGKRCVHIYDHNTGCEYKYLLIASKKIYDQWQTGEVLEFKGNDGIDVMNDVDYYLTQP